MKIVSFQQKDFLLRKNLTYLHTQTFVLTYRQYFELVIRNFDPKLFYTLYKNFYTKF